MIANKIKSDIPDCTYFAKENSGVQVQIKSPPNFMMNVKITNPFLE
jgi:hypothetical protein